MFFNRFWLFAYKEGTVPYPGLTALYASRYDPNPIISGTSRQGSDMKTVTVNVNVAELSHTVYRRGCFLSNGYRISQPKEYRILKKRTPYLELNSVVS